MPVSDPMQSFPHVVSSLMIIHIILGWVASLPLSKPQNLRAEKFKDFTVCLYAGWIFSKYIKITPLPCTTYTFTSLHQLFMFTDIKENNVGKYNITLCPTTVK